MQRIERMGHMRIGAVATCLILLAAVPAMADDVQPSLEARWSAETPPDETPTFRRHVAPLLGKLGCNGRACHGSFQGQGGFQLSLFGYDFEFDHEQIAQGEEPRVDPEAPEFSLALMKPTLEIPHEGGHVLKTGSWQYRVLHRWIEQGAKPVGKDDPEFVRLEVTPKEIVADEQGDVAQLKAVAVWSDGSREDVTPLCRFYVNDDQVATIDEQGQASIVGPGDTFLIVSYDGGVVSVPVMLPVSDRAGENYPPVPTPTKIDELVVQKLRKLGIVPSELASDTEFLRRVRLDMTGTLPTPAEVQAFLKETSPDKRARKIDELLESPAYAAWWATRLCDWTGNNSDGLNNVGLGRQVTSQEWYDWIRERIARNQPYDELVEGIVLATGREKGQSLEEYFRLTSSYYQEGSDTKFADRETMPHYWARTTFRNPDDRAMGFAYNFLGIRIQCAQCHKHPFDVWTKDDFAEFTGFFRNVRYGQDPQNRDEVARLAKEFGMDNARGVQGRRERTELLRSGKPAVFEEVFLTPARAAARNNNRNRNNRQAPAASAKLLGGETIDLTAHEDARSPLMEWLRREDNPYFAKAFVNRVWAAYFNVGIVDPPDDLSLGNPPSNTALLDYLAEGFVQSGYDMKWLHREIANSRTYQTTWVPNETNRNDQRNFSHSIPRRLPAEVAYDALRQATAADDVAATFETELADRAIALAESGTRAPRNGPGYAMQIFGRSNRDTNCDCDRSMESSLLQTIYLQNDRDVLAMLESRDSWISQLEGKARSRGDDRSDERRLLAQRKRLNEQIPRLQKRLEQAQKSGNKQQLQQAAQQLEQARKRRQRLNEQLPEQPAAAASKGVPADLPPVEELVTQAYLRTVSRLPDDDERAAATEFIRSAESPIAGTRDLLWALVNTKEFVVNH